jgi:DNA-binding beta-propeller fold protein YncE
MRLLLVCAAALVLCGAAGAVPLGGTPLALVTAEGLNELIAVDLSSGKVVQRLRLPAQPENIDGLAVVSTRAGTVSLLSVGRRVRVAHIVRGFRAPHIAVSDPSGAYVYVSDDAAGTLTTIARRSGKVVARIAVGAGAHHMSISAGANELWVALGERARRIVIVDITEPTALRVIGSFDPGFAAHDLAFAPDARRIWITSDDSSSVAVLDVATHRLLFRVPVGPPPQHVVFWLRSAYLTSGYGDRIEQVDARTGTLLHHARVAHGSFNLATVGSFVLTASLLNGTLTELTDTLKPVRVLHLAPSTRDVGGATGP